MAGHTLSTGYISDFIRGGCGLLCCVKHAELMPGLCVAEEQGPRSAAVLQKAMRFRDEIKQKIRRSPSTQRDNRGGQAGGKSPRHKRRTASFKEERRRDAHVTKSVSHGPLPARVLWPLTSALI